MIAYEQHLETVARKNSLLTGRDRDWLGVGVKEKRAEGKIKEVGQDPEIKHLELFVPPS